MLEELVDADLERVAVAKLEGLSNGEIARRLGCAPRSVGRKLRVIRTLWEEEAAP